MARALACGRALGAALIAVAGLAARGAEIKITAPPQLKGLPATLSAIRVDGAGSPIERTVSVPGTLDLAVGAGLWEIRIAGDGLWAPPAHVRGDASVDVEVWPAVDLEGTAKGVTSLRVGFLPLDEGGPSGESPCRIEHDSWRCLVPSGRYDLRFSSSGFAPEFRFGVTAVANGKPLPLTFVPGASLSGHVDPARGVKIPPAGADVTLSSAAGERSAWKQMVRTDQKGFFQFKGVAPGDYTLRGDASGLTTQSESVKILAGVAAELRAPLVLDVPKRLTVMLVPRLDPSGRPWRVRLAMNNPRTHHADIVAESPSGETGEWIHPRLIAGSYTVEILTANGERWKSQDVTMGANDETVAVAAFASKLVGSIMLGDRPLQATLSFGDEWGPKLQSDSEGKFSGDIPPGEHDERVILVQADTPRIKRTIRAKLEKGEGNELRLAITLPATTLMGRVLKEDRSPEPHAFLTVRGLDPLVFEQAYVESDGSFQLAGFEPGTYRVVADGPQSKSRYVSVDLRTGELTETELILEHVEPLRGRITAGEVPVVAAEVYVFPRDAWAASMPMIRTDERGYFEAELPPGTTVIDDCVIHPAFDVAFGRTTVQHDKQLHIRAQQLGGTVTVESKSNTALLSHAAAEMPALWLANAAGGTVTPGRMTIPRLMPGQYSACLADKSKCASGYLPPHGTLTLSLDPATN